MKHSGISASAWNPRIQAQIASALYGHKTSREVPNPQPQHHEAPTLGVTAKGEKEGVRRVTVRFTGYRVRPLDPDNFAGSVKDLLDGLRHAGLLRGDEPWRIKLETEQVKVGSFADEETVIEVEV